MGRQPQSICQLSFNTSLNTWMSIQRIFQHDGRLPQKPLERGSAERHNLLASSRFERHTVLQQLVQNRRQSLKMFRITTQSFKIEKSQGLKKNPAKKISRQNSGRR